MAKPPEKAPNDTQLLLMMDRLADAMDRMAETLEEIQKRLTVMAASLEEINETLKKNVEQNPQP